MTQELHGTMNPSNPRSKTKMRLWKSSCLFSWVNAKSNGRKRITPRLRRYSNSQLSSVSSMKHGAWTWHTSCSWKRSRRKPLICSNHSIRSRWRIFCQFRQSCSQIYVWHWLWSPRTQRQRRSWRKLNRRKRNLRRVIRTSITTVLSIWSLARCTVPRATKNLVLTGLWSRWNLTTRNCHLTPGFNARDVFQVWLNNWPKTCCW